VAQVARNLIMAHWGLVAKHVGSHVAGIRNLRVWQRVAETRGR